MDTNQSTATSDRFRRVAEGMTRVVESMPDEGWAKPSPCEGWSARDVLHHLVEWVPGPGFLLGTFGIDTAPIPSVDVDPAGAWAAVRDAVQRGLDDASIAERVEDCGPPGQLSFNAAVEMTCLPDVFFHTWDIAVAAGLDATLDPTEVALQAAGLDSIPPEMDQMMRGSGMFGPKLPVDPGADAQTRVLAFFGRRATA